MQTGSSSTIDLAYTAGLIDGEGLLCVRRGARGKNPDKRQYTPMIVVAMTDPGVIHWLHETWGGSFFAYDPSPNNGRRRVYRWSLMGAKAVALIRQLEPYMRTKNLQAALLGGFPVGRPGASISQAQRDLQHELWMCLKDAKRPSTLDEWQQAQQNATALLA